MPAVGVWHDYVIRVVGQTYMVTLDGATWLRFVVWMVAGFFVYGFYSRHRSRLN